MNKSILKYCSAPLALLLITSCSSSDSSEAIATATETVTSAAESSTSKTTSTAEETKTETASVANIEVDKTDKKKVTLSGNTYTFAKDVQATSSNEDQISTDETGDKLLIVKVPNGFNDSKYVGLTAYVEGTNPTQNTQNNDGDYEPYVWDNVKSSGMALQGGLTPIADLPQKADYSGDYWVSFERSEVANPDDIEVQYDTSAGRSWSSTHPGFTATADFASNKMSGKFYGDDNNDGKVNEVGALAGDISGNSFTGNLNIPEETFDDGRVDDAINIPLKGGFFGPAAAEIGGTGYGEYQETDRDYLFDNNGNAIMEDNKHKFVDIEENHKVSVGFVGTKQVAPN